jgi:hypothetical protein
MRCNKWNTCRRHRNYEEGARYTFMSLNNNKSICVASWSVLWAAWCRQSIFWKLVIAEYIIILPYRNELYTFLWISAEVTFDIRWQTTHGLRSMAAYWSHVAWLHIPELASSTAIRRHYCIRTAGFLSNQSSAKWADCVKITAGLTCTVAMRT